MINLTLMTNRVTITKRLIDKIQSSRYLSDDFYLNIGLDKCNRVHQAYEKIFVNLAANSGHRWQNIFHASPRLFELFSELCIAVILLDRCLKNRFKYNSSERREIMGPRFCEIIDRYKMALEGNY